jgi:hypothetical protein
MCGSFMVNEINNNSSKQTMGCDGDAILLLKYVGQLFDWPPKRPLGVAKLYHRYWMQEEIGR